MTSTIAEPTVLEMAKDLVAAQIQAGGLEREAMQQHLADTHDNLLALKRREQSGEPTAAAPPLAQPPKPSGWRQSITQHAVTCLECGSVHKQLTIRHFRQHDLTARSYRAKYGIPKNVPLAAKATTARRRQVVQETRPWEKTPRYLATQAATAVPKQQRGRAAAKRSK